MLRRTVLYGGLLVAIVAALVGTLPTTTAAGPRVAESPQAIAIGTLPTSAGPHITDLQLAQMLNQFIPAANAHSTLLLFTQCYGGLFFDDFAGRPGTTVLSADTLGMVTYYGGYHDDAARALRPGVGRTSDDVHAAGLAGHHPMESPGTQGPPVSLGPTGQGGINSRHILVYAGRPNAMDQADCANIENNFAGQANTTVTTVGCAGTSGQDQPATLAGLRAALQAIGAQMNPNEQFILFVTDHGDWDAVDPAPACTTLTTCTSELLPVAPWIWEDMQYDPLNEPVIDLLSPNPVEGPTTIVIQPPPPEPAYSFFDVYFDIQIDLNGDGDTNDEGEGWLAQVSPDEALINPGGQTVIAQNPNGIFLSQIGLGSGAIGRRWTARLFLPIIQRAAP